jgi:PAS domain S-box-containing protein
VVTHAENDTTPAPHVGASDEFQVLEAQWSLGLLVQVVQEYAIFTLDPTGHVRTWNVGARRIKGYTDQEILGQHFSVFYPPEERQANLPDQELAHATRHGQWSGEGWRVRKDGTQFWASVVITAVFDPLGGLDGFVKVTRDESDRKSAEETPAARWASPPERERIAVQLSGTTVRNIFSATLALDGARAMSTDPSVTRRIADAMAILDRTLTEIRTAVAGLVPIRELSHTTPTPLEPHPDAPRARRPW